MKFQVIRSEEKIVENMTRYESKQSNTELTAKTIRALFLRLKREAPNASTKELVDLTATHAAEKTPAGNWVYLAGRLNRSLSRASVLQYLHGTAGGTHGRRVIGEDLIGLRPRAEHAAIPRRAVSLSPVLDRLDSAIARLDDLREILVSRSNQQQRGLDELATNLRRFIEVSGGDREER